MYRVICTCGTSIIFNLKEKKKNMSLIYYLFYKKYTESQNIGETFEKTVNYIKNWNLISIFEDLKMDAIKLYENIVQDTKTNYDLSQIKSMIFDKLDQSLLSQLDFISSEEYLEPLSFKLFKNLHNKDGFIKDLDDFFTLDIKKLIRNISAECNAMAFYFDETIGRDEVKDKLNKVYLISSDTELGFKAATITQDCLKVMLKYAYDLNKELIFEVKRIDGLTIMEKNTFETRGIKEYLKYLFKIRYQDIKNDYEYVINLTGGFKATIPYTVYFASIFDLDIFYIHERGDYGVIFPKIPIKFESIYEDLKTIKEYVDKGEIDRALTYANEKNMVSFIDYKENKFNEFGNVLLELIEEKWDKEVLKTPTKEPKKKQKNNIFDIFKRKSG